MKVPKTNGDSAKKDLKANDSTEDIKMANGKSSSTLEILEEQIKGSYARVIRAHSIQNKCAEILFRRSALLVGLQVVLAALTILGLVAILIGNNIYVEIITPALALILLCVAKNNVKEIAQKHAVSAHNMWDVRECYLSLLTDIRTGELSNAEIRLKRDSLQYQLSFVYKGSPRIISKAYQNAKNAMVKDDEIMFIDQEINN